MKNNQVTNQELNETADVVVSSLNTKDGGIMNNTNTKEVVNNEPLENAVIETETPNEGIPKGVLDKVAKKLSKVVNETPKKRTTKKVTTKKATTKKVSKKVTKVKEPKVKLNANGKPQTKVESKRCDSLAYIVHQLVGKSRIPYRNLRINSQYYGQRQMLKFKPSKRLVEVTNQILSTIDTGGLI